MEYLIKNKKGVFVFCLLLLGAYYEILRGLPVQLFPQSSRAQFTISFPHPGISAFDFEQRFITPLRNATSAIDNLDESYYYIFDDNSNIELVFNWKVDPKIAREAVNQFINTMLSYLPSESRGYQLHITGKVSIQVTAFDQKDNAEETIHFLKNFLSPKILLVHGVDQVHISSPFLRKVVINLQQRKLLEYDLKFTDIKNKILTFRQKHLGWIDEKGNSPSVLFLSSLRTLAELKSIPLEFKKNKMLRLGDVASIEEITERNDSKML